MSAGPRELDGLREARLHAYHDGELSGLSRWRFERELRRSPTLQRELADLQGLGELLRRHDAEASTPDVWDSIALRLPAADARRAEGEGAPATAAWGARASWWLRPVGALAASAAVVATVVFGGFLEEAAAPGSVVRWIDSGNRSVMVLDDQPDTTIIWVLDGATEGAVWGGRREQV